MVRAYRWPRGVLSLLVVCMLSLGPFAQGVDAGLEDGIVPGKMDVIEPPASIMRPDARELLSNIDGFFTENLGQKGEGAGRFYCEGSPLSATFGTSWFAYNMVGEDASTGHLVRIELVEANQVGPIAIGASSHPSNFFLGKDPMGWVSGAGNFREIIYPEVYQGIDLHFKINSDRLKYEFLVQPGADPSSIRMRYSGVDGIAVDEVSGDLLIPTSVGTVRDEAPVSSQTLDEGRIDVPTSFLVLEGDIVTFDIGPYDRHHPLLIDPALLFSTFLGGNDDEGWSGGKSMMNAEYDDEMNIVVGSRSISTDFPTTPGAYRPVKNRDDCVIFKLKHDGSALLFSTWLGGDKFEHCLDVEIDDNGDVFVCGETYSFDFPAHSGAIFEDRYMDGEAFVAHFNPNCSKLLHCTYIVGDGGEVAYNLHLSSNDTLLVTGMSGKLNLSTDLGAYENTSSGDYEIFLARIGTNLSNVIAWTYLGGRLSEGNPTYSCVDENGTVYISSRTDSTDFPTTANAFQKNNNGGENDLVVAAMSADLSNLLFSTYLGGSNYEKVQKVRLAPDGDLLVVGNTNSTDFPTSTGCYDSTHNGGHDGFISKIDTNTGTLTYSTYFGDDDDDTCMGIHHDAEDRYLISMTTTSTGLPSQTSQNNGSYDAYFCFLDIEKNTVSWGEFFGGSQFDALYESLYDGTSAVFLGVTESTDLPTTSGAFDRSFNGETDIFVFRCLVDFSNGTPPSEPINLTAVAGDGMATLNWDPPTENGTFGMLGYKVFRGTSEGSLTPVAQVGPDFVEHTDKAVTNGKTYFYGLKAFNWFGESNISNIVTTTPLGVPSEVASLEAIPGNHSVLLRWTPPVNDGGEPLLGYQVYQGNAMDGIRHLIQLDNVTEYTDEGLTNGQTYYYQVFAFNRLGNAITCKPVIATPAGLPTEPRYLTVTPGNLKLKLDWSQPQIIGAEVLLGYIIFRGTSADSLEKYITVDQSTRTYVDVGLTNGVAYYYAIKATNRVGEGKMSLVVQGIPAGIPLPPRNLVCEGSDGSVTLTWEPPEFDGGAPITSYHILRGSSGDLLGHFDMIQADATIYNDTGLLNGQTFYYAVSAINGMGEGPWSEVVGVTPLAFPDPPGDPVAIAGNGMVTISWLRPMDNGGAEITQYSIHRGTSEDDLQPLLTRNKSTFIYDDFYVVVGTTYHYAVASVTAAGEGPTSPIASATPYGPPGIPTDLVATPGDSEVSLHWSAPGNDGASPIVGFIVLRGESTASLREIAQLGDVTSYLDTYVTNGITYLYVIAAINEAGPGDHTEPVSATPIKSPTAPGKVTTLVTDVNGNKVTLQWSKPQDDGDSPVTGYVILRGLAIDSLEQVAEVGPSATTWSEDGLKRGTTYYYSVAAKNDVGEGEPILAREVKVPKEAESPGFEAFAVLAALLIVVHIVRRRVV